MTFYAVSYQGSENAIHNMDLIDADGSVEALEIARSKITVKEALL